MSKQICTKCNLEKEVTEFYKGNNKIGLTYRCKSCFKEDKERFKNNNPDYFKNYASKNKEKIKKHKDKYLTDNREKCRKAVSKYSTSEKGRAAKRKRQKIRTSIDPLFKLKKNLRTRIWSMLKNDKDKNTEELLGCDFQTVKEHLESTFTKGMSWENYGKWHVDHRIPLASAKNKGEVEKLFHYTNLQALWAADNFSKNDKF